MTSIALRPLLSSQLKVIIFNKIFSAFPVEELKKKAMKSGKSEIFCVLVMCQSISMCNFSFSYSLKIFSICCNLKIKISKARHLQLRRKFYMTSGVIQSSLNAKYVHYHYEHRTISSSSLFICILRPSLRDAMPVSFAASIATARTWRLYGPRTIGRFDLLRRIRAMKISQEMQQVVSALHSRNWVMLENTSVYLEIKTPSKR